MFCCGNGSDHDRDDMSSSEDEMPVKKTETNNEETNAKSAAPTSSMPTKKKRTDEDMRRISQLGSAATETEKKLVKALRKCALLKGRADSDLLLMVRCCEMKIHQQGEYVFKKGDVGDGLYLIGAGTVLVGRNIAELGPGDYFGEAALLKELPRGADVQCKDGPLKCLFWTRKVFIDLTEELWKVNVKEGSTIMRQGQRGDLLYVIERGGFDIYVNEDGKSGLDGDLVASIGAKSMVGELALMYNTRRNATVVANTASVCWAIDRFSFRRRVKEVSQKTLAKRARFLKKVDLLRPLSEFERSKIAEALEEVRLPMGRVLIEEGKKGDCMYIIKSGTVICSREDGSLDHVDRKNLTFMAGDYIGEKALFNDEQKGRRAATVTTLKDSVLLRLNRDAVLDLLGPLEDVLKSSQRTKQTKREKQSKKNAKDAKKELGNLNSVGVQLNEFRELGVLGQGSFGRVTLVECPNKNTYALKAVSKTQIVEQGQEDHLKNEKRVLHSLKHPFFIQMYATYQDDRSLYFLLELVQGGELFTLLRDKTFFDHNVAQFYLAQVVVMFKFLHSKDIIYRDLKPENLLLGTDGYLKMTDFGFAKYVAEGKTFTLCGTPDYLAPEIVSGEGHDRGVDWWCTGVLLFEMLASYPPFFDDEPMATYSKIIKPKINSPSHFSKTAISLCKDLIKKQVHKRLGCLKGGGQDVMDHPYFDGFSFEQLEAKQLKAPFTKPVEDKTDMSNFDQLEEDRGEAPVYRGNEDWCKGW